MAAGQCETGGDDGDLRASGMFFDIRSKRKADPHCAFSGDS